MHVTLWILQVLLAVIFAIAGVTHFLPPEGLPEAMRGVAEMPAGVPYFIGAVEILAALGLILPGLTGIQTRSDAAGQRRTDPGDGRRHSLARPAGGIPEYRAERDPRINRRIRRLWSLAVAAVVGSACHGTGCWPST